MNDAINKIDTVVKHITTNTHATVIPMYPGDRWTPGVPHDPQPALDRYAQDYARGVEELHTSPVVPWTDLEKLAMAYIGRLKKKNEWFWVRLAGLPPVRWFDAVTIYLTDLQRCARFDIFNGLRPSDATLEQADIIMASDSLAYVFRFEWGDETLYVNGRFRAGHDQLRKFNRCLSLARLNNTGRTFGPHLLLDREFATKAIGHFYPKMKPWLTATRAVRPKTS
jgi:UDP-MurNAc hydroxylase